MVPNQDRITLPCGPHTGLPSGHLLHVRAAQSPLLIGNLLKNPVIIRGLGMSAELDESSFSKKKYNRGRILPNQ